MFDPNKPFEIIEETPEEEITASRPDRTSPEAKPETSGFDPSKPFSVLKDSEERGFFEPGGAFEAGAAGLAQGLSFGFADEIEAGVKSVFSDKSYDTLLQEVRNRQARARNNNPVISTTADIAGGIATGLATGGLGLAAKGASALTKVGQAAKVGAGFGALEAGGRTEADLMSAEGLKDVAKGAAVGGLTGGALQGIGEGVKKGAEVLTKKFGKDALRKALLEPSSKKLRELNFKKPEVIDNAAETASKYGVFKKNTEDTYKALKETQNKIGEELSSVASSLDPSLQGVDEAWTSLQDDLVSAKESILNDEAVGKLTKLQAKRTAKLLEENFEKVNNLAQKDGNLISAIREVKTNLGQKLKTDDFLSASPLSPTKDQIMRSYDALQKVEDDLINIWTDKLSDTTYYPMADAVARVQKLNQDYKNLKHFEDFFTSQATKGKSPISMQDIANLGTLGGGGFGAAVGGMVAGPAGAAVTGPGALILQKYVSSREGKLLISKLMESGADMVALNKLPKFIQKIIEKSDTIPVVSGKISTQVLMDAMNNQGE